MTDGQQLAMEQLQEIEASSDGVLRIGSVQEASEVNGWVTVDVSLSCSGIPCAALGLPLRGRERLRILIPPGFPFAKPEVCTPHSRWEAFPHVQWKRHLCLYQAPSTEWNSADGMYGFLTRLDEWLRKGALNQLDPAGEPLHPPVAYPRTSQVVVPRIDTPSITNTAWYGYAHLRTKSEQRVDVVGWSALGATDLPSNTAATILLAEPMPFEYPSTVAALIAELETRGVPIRFLMTVLGLAVLSNEKDAPLYVIIGTPMRGTQGETRKQHLAAWYLDSTIALGLRLALEVYGTYQPLRELGQEAEQIIRDWAASAKVGWCSVLEDRPEVTRRRDEGTPIGWFAGKSVALWGCGALGSHIAEHLARAGVGRLALWDNQRVKPGIIARQQFNEADIGRPKADALAERLKQINPALDILPCTDNILDGPLGEDWTGGSDVVIDVTASESVLAKLELVRRTGAMPAVPVVSLAVGHRADRGLVLLSKPSYSGGPADVAQRTKIGLCNRGGADLFLDEFWPVRARHAVFQPEPGCSDATFVGSSADVAALTGAMLNLAAADLGDESGNVAFAHLLAQPRASSPEEKHQVVSLAWPADILSQDPDTGYETRISRPAWNEMLGWVSRSRRQVGPDVETGGLLFGRRDDASKIVWVHEVVGPPPDSVASAELFLCGVEGTKDANAEKGTRSRRSLQYVGMWHTHPNSVPVPSETDLSAMRRLVHAADSTASRSLLLIIGMSKPEPIVGTFVFHRSDFDSPAETIRARLCRITPVPHLPGPRRIGLALSGGGSRAMAFHLGCLRALADRGILDRLEVISAVSGGSVIAGMYAYSQDSFADFDARVVRTLRRGLLDGIVRRTFMSRRFPAILATAATAGVAAFVANITRNVLGRRLKRFQDVRPPWVRWASRTSALEDSLRDLLFGGKLVTDARRGDVNVVFNACELRTGTAFRFGNLESSCWRFGRVLGNHVQVAQAVAASAAYPVILPAIDRIFTFEKPDSEAANRRVLLTDGGIYDNLGISCLLPGRSNVYGYPPFDLDFIIACDAGAGQFGEEELPYAWASRLVRSFETVFRRVQNASQTRLHVAAASGRIKGLVYAYLGQQDTSLGYCPPDLVRREQVKDYPTNFSPMRQSDLDLLALRGEQLTRLLIDRYCPSL